MSRLPRLALATPPGGSEPTFASLAVLAGLTSLGWRVQHFRSRARPFGTATVNQVSGLPERHLDAWLMPTSVSRQVFLRGVRRCDLAIVEGTLDPYEPRPIRYPFDAPGRLAPLIEALDLPLVALVPCAGLSEVHLPNLPGGVQAVLVDGLERPEEFESIKRLMELVFRKPVLGAIEALPEIRRALARLSIDEVLPESMVETMSQSFRRFADLAALQSVAESQPFPEVMCEEPSRPRRRFQVAYAQDEAFGGYYPDTLEMLSTVGAELIEFSPLRSESLPEGVDLVIIGCGFPDRYAEELAANMSLIASLRAHVCRGHRLYTEGGGTVYLGRTMIIGDQSFAGAGILPFDAVLRETPREPTPISRTLMRESWLGPAGTPVRGYRCGRWSLREAGEVLECPGRSGPLTAQHDMFYRHHAIGSLIHLYLAALPQVIDSFIGPHQPSLWLSRRAPSP